jgi:hypothetical protein
MRFPSVTAICLIAFMPLMTGCTPEKAEALLTAIKAFESHSNQALAAYEGLFKEYRTLKRESQDDLFIQAYDATNKQGVKYVTFGEAVANVGQLESAKASSQIENEFLQLKSAYSMLSSAYESLPQGSLIGAQHVSCGRKAVAKLTKQLVNFSSDINKSPLYPAVLRQDFAEFKALAVQGAAQKDGARKKFDAFYSGVTEYEKRHLEAVTKTLAAVEQGQRLNQLLAQYDAVTISNILAVIQYGFSFAGTLNGVDISKSSARLKDVKDNMEKTEYWKWVESIPLASVAQCKIQPGEKEN